MTAHPEHKERLNRSRAATKIVAALVTVACVTAGGYFLYQRRAQAQETSAPEPAAEQRVAVVTTPAAVRDFERSLVVQGNVEAKNFAMVSPRVAGTIETICVEEGDAVTADETMLFQTDAVALEESVQIGRHNLTVATCAKREALAGLEKTRADFHKAELDYGRFQRLFEQKAVTADAFEQQQSRYQQLTAAVKLAEAQVDLTAAREDQAKAALAIAEKNLADATINAPISGTVSQRLQEPGEMGKPGEPVLRIDDTTVVEVAAYLPAEYYAEVRPGQTAMKIQISGIDPGTQTVTYKSPTIDARLRAFEVKCVLTNPPEGIT
ncbi:MAG: efflux RND transporter periplasmic adaptor subunit, partial [Sedimentisphaerales bacterium]|nr:efflux RND transporter periplasmic adaptor subunit [Sedimentisphaerales bacterium]